MITLVSQSHEAWAESHLALLEFVSASESHHLHIAWLKFLKILAKNSFKPIK